MCALHRNIPNILIVDDRPEGLLTLEAVLGSENYNLVRANSGREALTRLAEQDFALIILDVQMPELDGFQTATLIKNQPKLHSIPIIFVTAISKDERFVDLGYNVGAVDYLFKPFEPRILQAKVSVFVELYRKNQQILEQAELLRQNDIKERNRQVAIRAAEIKAQFFASMSHDIRTPMNMIIGMIDLLSRTRLSEEQSNFVQMLNKASENLLSLVNNVLDLSKIESGRFEIEQSEFDLLETVETVLDIISPRAHSKGLEVIFKGNPDIPRVVLGDASRLKQILINLLGNAVKFTGSGEIILSIETKPISEKQIALAFFVRDTGIGIAQSQTDKIFDHFTQLKTKMRTTSEGSGLGLSICKRLAELMGGTISVDSTVGKGSTFCFRAPFGQVPTAEDHPKELKDVSLKGRRILIFDDNAALCLSLTKQLSEMGAIVASASTGDQAKELIGKEPKKFDLIFADIRVPGTLSGGLDVLRQFQDDSGLMNSIIMMLPTNHRHGDLELIKKTGIKNYIMKPVKVLDLKRVVARALNPKPAALRESAAEALNAPEKLKLIPLNVLVVDDSEDNRILVELYFKNTPFKYVMAESGFVALEKFKTQTFDLVLMDLQMPKMDGYDALRAIRKWESAQNRKKTPIVALTAYALKEEAEKSIAAGFTAHVTKPIRKDELIEVVLANSA